MAEHKIVKQFESENSHKGGMELRSSFEQHQSNSLVPQSSIDIFKTLRIYSWISQDLF